MKILIAIALLGACSVAYGFLGSFKGHYDQFLQAAFVLGGLGVLLISAVSGLICWWLA